MVRLLITLTAGLLAVGQTGCGCLNRCASPGGGWFGGPTTIAPPPTYSLNIPSVSRNSPYYTPGQGSAAGTETAGNWRPSGSDAAGQPTAATDTRIAESLPNARGASVVEPLAPQTRLAAVPTSGTGRTFSAGQPSSTDPRWYDSTRVPVNDATASRAPSRNLIANYGVPQTYAQGYPGAPQVFSAPGMAIQNLAPTQAQVYSANPTIVGGPNAVIASRPADPYAATSGWRGREMGSDWMR